MFADAIRQHLVCVPVQHRDVLESFQHCLDLFSIIGPEIPWPI